MKMSKTFEKTLNHKTYISQKVQMEKQAHKKMFNTISRYENENQNHNEVSLPIHYGANSNNNNNNNRI
jgi:hypothetical protein